MRSSSLFFADKSFVQSRYPSKYSLEAAPFCPEYGYGNPWRGGPRAKIFISPRIPVTATATSGNYLDRDTDLPPREKFGKISRVDHRRAPPKFVTISNNFSIDIRYTSNLFLQAWQAALHLALSRINARYVTCHHDANFPILETFGSFAKKLHHLYIYRKCTRIMRVSLFLSSIQFTLRFNSFP